LKLNKNKNTMKAIIIIDAQNEFSLEGKRPVPDHSKAIRRIRKNVDDARRDGLFIAWVRHFNRSDESPAFVPGTWGAEFVEGLGVKMGADKEREFQKQVYGAFTGTNIGSWIEENNIHEVDISGFYTHGCVSTTAREAIMAGLMVSIDMDATATCSLNHEILGVQTAGEIHRSALMELANMGVEIYRQELVTQTAMQR
jgi:nicotinamidase-related amidase